MRALAPGSLERIVETLYDVYRKSHADMEPGEWSAKYGRLLVYGTQRLIGFPGAVNLESQIEQAHREGRKVLPVLERVLKEYLK